MIVQYKAWHKEMQKMFDVKKIDYSEETVLFVDTFEDATFDDIDLLQTTSQTDKNGKIIFEGDIVELRVPNPTLCGLYKVHRAPSGEWRIDNSIQGRAWKLAGSNNCTIVGNVFENNELLED